MEGGCLGCDGSYIFFWSFMGFSGGEGGDEVFVISIGNLGGWGWIMFWGGIRIGSLILRGLFILFVF